MYAVARDFIDLLSDARADESISERESTASNDENKHNESSFGRTMEPVCRLPERVTQKAACRRCEFHLAHGEIEEEKHKRDPNCFRQRCGQAEGNQQGRRPTWQWSHPEQPEQFGQGTPPRSSR